MHIVGYSDGESGEVFVDDYVSFADRNLLTIVRHGFPAERRYGNLECRGVSAEQKRDAGCE